MTENTSDRKESRSDLIDLFLWSFLSLFIELLIIRWLSSDIRAFIVFRTFPLVSCFVGFGLGYSSKKEIALKGTPFALLFVVMCMKIADETGFCQWGFPSASVFQWQDLAMMGNSVTFLGIFGVGMALLLSSVLVTCFCLGTKIGHLFNQISPLKAYAVNLLGGGIGSLAFTGLSFCGASPEILVTAVAAVMVILALKQRFYAVAIGCICTAGIALTPELSTNLSMAPDIVRAAQASKFVKWSPYQRIDVTTFKLNENGKERPIGLELGVNRAFYQYFLDDTLDESKLPPTLAKLIGYRRTEYELPFKFQPNPKDVLIVGAGTGQNVVNALRHGATDVDAVEIDPVILKLGKTYNEKMSDPAVHRICDDARHYFNSCQKKYDLIVFTLLDSHAVSGQGSSVRLDCYVYTQQSLAKAASLLKPNGVLFMSFAAMPKIETRLNNTLKAAYPGQVYRVKAGGLSRDIALFVLGNNINPSVLPEGYKVVPPSNENIARPVLTDDWPYLYVDPSIIDWPYLCVTAVILLLSIVLARKTLFQSNTTANYWQLFFLGAGFLLLELAAIARLALLFGSTWVNSAVVINCILIMLFCANLFMLKVKAVFNTKLAYAGLFICLIGSYLIPLNQIVMHASQFGFFGLLGIALITLSPMLFAGLIFPQALASAKVTSKALTFNILGSVVGGLLEYLSYFTGTSGLIIISGLLYAASMICFFANKPEASNPEPVNADAAG